MPITPLHAVSQNHPGTVPSGTVILYKDTNWSSESLTLSTSDNTYQPNQWQSITGMPMQDKASWIAFNLPVGTVMTLTDNSVSQSPVSKSPSSTSQSPPPIVGLKNAGRVVDLVGTGQTVTVDLTKINMNDCISAFLWRTVDLTMGAIELYEDSNFAGNRTVLFLAEWPTNTVVSLQDWYISGRLSSARWDTLRDVQLVTLTSSPDGSGKVYGNISGSGAAKEQANLGEVGFNDCVNSFKWSSVVPMKEIIAPINVTFPPTAIQGTSQSNSNTVSNPTTDAINGTVTLEWSYQSSLTVSSSDSYQVGSSVTVTTKTGADVIIADTEVDIAVSVSFNYTHTDGSSTTTGQTITKTNTLNFPVPPGKTVTGTITAMQGTTPAAQYQTTARRWYQNQLAGTTQDPANNNWWVRNEPLTLTLQGSQTLGVTSRVTSS